MLPLGSLKQILSVSKDAVKANKVHSNLTSLYLWYKTKELRLVINMQVDMSEECDKNFLMPTEEMPRVFKNGEGLI